MIHYFQTLCTQQDFVSVASLFKRNIATPMHYYTFNYWDNCIKVLIIIILMPVCTSPVI